jgi:hypothetical protein
MEVWIFIQKKDSFIHWADTTRVQGKSRSQQMSMKVVVDLQILCHGDSDREYQDFDLFFQTLD